MRPKLQGSDFVQAPTAVAMWPKDIALAPRELAARLYNKWAANLCASPAGALIVLDALTHRGFSQTIDDHVGRVTTSVNLAKLEKFVDVQCLEEKINQVSQSDCSVEERAAIQEFQKQLRRRRDGKPESDFLNNDED